MASLLLLLRYPISLLLIVVKGFNSIVDSIEYFFNKFVFAGQLVRVYPSGMRIDSSNFNPITIWSCGIQMVAMNYQTVTDANLHLHNSYFQGTQGYILKPPVMWNSSHILYERFLPASKTQEGLHVTHVSLTIVSGQYVCRENYLASPLVEVEVIHNGAENFFRKPS